MEDGGKTLEGWSKEGWRMEGKPFGQNPSSSYATTKHSVAGFLIAHVGSFFVK